MRKRVSGRTAWNLRVQAGTASNYIRHFVAEAYLGMKVVLCCRVSRRAQNRTGNLANQLANLEFIAASAGCVVVEKFCHVGSGNDPFWLIEVTEFALAHGAALLAEATDRFIRNQYYHSNTFPDAQATKGELETLQWHTEGITLMTVLPPDASPKEVKSYQRKRGQMQKGRKGGRTKKRKQRIYPLETKAKGIRMHDHGFSYQDVADFLTEHTKDLVPRSTVQGWVRARNRQGVCAEALTADGDCRNHLAR